jgi:hypothetical protein
VGAILPRITLREFRLAYATIPTRIAPWREKPEIIELSGAPSGKFSKRQTNRPANCNLARLVSITLKHAKPSCTEQIVLRMPPRPTNNSPELQQAQRAQKQQAAMSARQEMIAAFHAYNYPPEPPEPEVVVVEHSAVDDLMFNGFIKRL